MAVAFLAADTKAKGSPYGTLVILVIVLVLGYFFLRSSRRKQRANLAARSNVEVGAEVLTTSGMIAKVIDVEDDHVTLEIAPGVRSRFLAQAVVRTITPAEGSEHEGTGVDAPAPVAPLSEDVDAPGDSDSDTDATPEDPDTPPRDDSVKPA